MYHLIIIIMKKTINVFLLLAIVLLSSCQNKTNESEAAQPTKIADYLWEITVDDYCDSIPNSLINHVGKEFSCSAVRNGNFYGRNLDFFISEFSEFIIHVPAKEGRHASVGVGRLDSKTDADIEQGLSKKELDILTWGMFDGINDAGLFCNMNVTPYDDGGENPGTNPGKPDIYSAFLIRALLDNCGSVDEAIDYINNHNVIGKDMGGFNLHFMIGDPEKNVVLEFINNEAVIKEQYIMTNFYVNMDHKTPSADGVERYDILKANYAEGGESMEGMYNLMKRVRFSQTYDINTKPFWKSEYHEGGRFAWDAPLDSVLATPSVQVQIDRFKHYKETGEYKPEWKLWFTTHNSTYNIKERKLWITIREQYDKHYEFEI